MIHWCQDETNAAITAIGSAGLVWTWIKCTVVPGSFRYVWNLISHTCQRHNIRR